MSTSSNGEDVEQLRSERDRLQRELEEARAGKHRRARKIVAAALVVLTVLTLAAAVPGTWARRTSLNTDRFVATVEPLASDPAIQQYLAMKITDATFEALDVQGRLQTALSERLPRLTFLAGPITQAVHDFVQAQVQKLVATPQFQQLWVEAIRIAHEHAVALLEGESNIPGVDVSGGKVTVNLLPFVNQALQQLGGLVSDLVGREVTLPEITPEMIQSAPQEALQKIESALGVTLPSDFGTITVWDSKELAAAQQAVQSFNRLILLLVLAFVLFFALALVISPSRRRTLLQIVVAAAVVLVIERRLAIAGGHQLVGDVSSEAQGAVQAIVDAVLGSLLRYTGWLLAIALVTIVVAVATAPYGWVVRGRAAVGGAAFAAFGMVRGTQGGPAAVWIGAHRDLLLAGVAVLTLILLLWLNLSFWWALLLLVVAGLVALAVWRTAEAVGRVDA
jgi:ABC-type multidrug transport system fused ATPase/permease subunit